MTESKFDQQQRTEFAKIALPALIAAESFHWNVGRTNTTNDEALDKRIRHVAAMAWRIAYAMMGSEER